MRECHILYTNITFFCALFATLFLSVPHVFAGEAIDNETNQNVYSLQIPDNNTLNIKPKFKELFKNWNARVGALAMYIPDYSGSKDMRFMVLPLIVVDYRRFIVLTYASVSAFVPVPRTKYKLLLGVTLSYDYIGIGVTNFEEPEYGIVLAPTLMFNPNKYINATFTANKSLKGSDGLELELKIRTKIDLLKQLELGFEASGKYSDTNRMRFKYGVSHDESIEHSYPSYYPGGSFTSTSFGISMRYKFSKKLTCNFIYQAEILLNNAAKSPTTETIYQPKTVIMLSYAF